MNNWDIIKRNINLENGQIEKMENAKRKLDNINYVNLYQNAVDGDLFLPNAIPGEKVRLFPLDKIEAESNIKSTFDAIKGKLKENIKIGAVSNGVHSIDFFATYFTPEIIHDIEKRISWSDKKVMFVFEAPSCNLDHTYGYYENSYNEIPDYIKALCNNQEEQSNDDLLQKLLTTIWWRLNDTSNTRPISDYPDWYKKIWTNNISDQKQYDCFLLSMMAIFGLSHIYHTNLLRYELFDINKSENRKRESALGWDETKGIQNGEIFNIAYDGIFEKEMNEFDPDIIFATSKPFDYLRSKGISYPIYKILHPTCHLPNDQRLCINICHIAKALLQEDIISRDSAIKIIDRYLTLKE